MPKPRKKSAACNAAPLGFEARLRAAADALRNNMDAAEYKHVVLGLIFLKYISDALAANHAGLDAEKSHGADPEDPDECRAASIFRVPMGARSDVVAARELGAIRGRQPGGLRRHVPVPGTETGHGGRARAMTIPGPALIEQIPAPSDSSGCRVPRRRRCAS